jgi:XTP/dITP diphosphohydrolase
MRVFIASSNPGKLRDFAGAAAVHGVGVELLPGFREMPEAVEDGDTFEANARKKSEHYSRYAPGLIVVADDSGLEVDALDGAPGVISARYASEDPTAGNSSDEANNAKLLRELEGKPDAERLGQFVCVVSVARDGVELASFEGTARGMILREPRGDDGFGYDPLFYRSKEGKTFGELSPEEKSRVSHRGEAFRRFLQWCDSARARGLI